MTVEQFADKCGFRLIRCERDWGGTYGYTTVDGPDCSICGFKTAKAARDRWFQDTFGPTAGRAVLALLKQAKQQMEQAA